MSPHHSNKAARSDRAQSAVDVHLVLICDGNVLLGQRINTGFADGCWHLPAGHLEDCESLPEAAAREALEELGITLELNTAELVHVMHQPGRVATFFTAHWRGTIRNMEPDKCADLGWFALDALPAEMTGYCSSALRAIADHVPFTTFGWTEDDNAEQAA